MRRLSWSMLVAALALGCGEDEAVSALPTVEEAPVEESPPAQASEVERADEDGDDVATPADFEEEVAAEVGEQNLEAEVARLEQEILGE